MYVLLYDYDLDRINPGCTADLTLVVWCFFHVVALSVNGTIFHFALSCATKCFVVVSSAVRSGVEPINLAGRAEEEQGLRGVPLEALLCGVRSQGQRRLQGGAEKIRLLSSRVSV